MLHVSPSMQEGNSGKRIRWRIRSMGSCRASYSLAGGLIAGAETGIDSLLITHSANTSVCAFFLSSQG